MKENEMKLIAELINKVVSAPKDEKIKKEVSEAVLELTSGFGMHEK
jgi:glycine/serine hydroxymethyltransferase